MSLAFVVVDGRHLLVFQSRVTVTKNSSDFFSVGGSTISSGMTSQYVACLQVSGVLSLGAGAGRPGSGLAVASGPKSFSTVWFSVIRIVLAAWSRAETGMAGLRARSPNSTAVVAEPARRPIEG